jgi:hypothetical protein
MLCALVLSSPCVNIQIKWAWFLGHVGLSAHNPIQYIYIYIYCDNRFVNDHEINSSKELVT